MDEQGAPGIWSLASGGSEEERSEQQEQRQQTEQGQNTGQEQSKQGKQVDFGDEEQLRETRAKSTDEPEVMGRWAEVRTGRGSSGLIRGGDERGRADEARKGKGKGSGGKCEHEGIGGGVGRKGTQQVENLVMDENHREDVRKLVEMMQKEEEDQEGQRGRVAPNMGLVAHTPRPCRCQKGERHKG